MAVQGPEGLFHVKSRVSFAFCDRNLAHDNVPGGRQVAGVTVPTAGSSLFQGCTPAGAGRTTAGVGLSSALNWATRGTGMSLGRSRSSQGERALRVGLVLTDTPRVVDTDVISPLRHS